MATSIVSVLLGLCTAAVSAIKGGWTQWKRHRARKAALDGEDHRDRGTIESLVSKGLLRLASVSDEGLPGNVEPDPFRDWLRDSDNLNDFARVYVAHIGQQPSASRDAEARLATQYTRRAGRPPTDFSDVLKRVVSFIRGPLGVRERDQNEESRALVRNTAAAVALLTRDNDPTDRVRHLATALVEFGKRSWKMPRFVAPLTLDVYEDRDGKPRLTASDELLTFIADGTPLLLYGAGGIASSTPAFAHELFRRNTELRDRTVMSSAATGGVFRHSCDMRLDTTSLKQRQRSAALATPRVVIGGKASFHT